MDTSIDGVSARRNTLVNTMQGRVGDEAGRSTSRVRRLATPIEVSAYLKVPVKTLYASRYEGKGPRAHRVGRHLRYRWEDVEAWLASSRLADETDLALSKSPSRNQQPLRRLLLERVPEPDFATSEESGIPFMT
jgi:excisionase family DNA binding protein